MDYLICTVTRLHDRWLQMLKKQSTNAKQHFDVDYTDFVGYVSEKKRLIFIYKCICCGCFVVAYVSNIKQPSFPTPFYSVLVSISVFMALSTVFHSINSPDNSPLSHPVLPVLFLPYWSFIIIIIGHLWRPISWEPWALTKQISTIWYISLRKSPSALIQS